MPLTFQLWLLFARRNGKQKIFGRPGITMYLREEHSPQQALAARVVFVAQDGTRLVGFAAGIEHAGSVATENFNG
jgi:hypothetical protein